jgi:valyl-tRNA synthetase
MIRPRLATAIQRRFSQSFSVPFSNASSCASAHSRLDVRYNPSGVKCKAQYDWWENEGLFSPKAHGEEIEREYFSMVLPPPNVTGVLHIGHALTVTIQDVLVRWNRMKGANVLWVPGTDHAGIATQSVVERQLMRDCQLSRRDFSREDFVQKIWEWRSLYGSRITTQLRDLGASHINAESMMCWMIFACFLYLQGR